jgi:hypothetical protein
MTGSNTATIGGIPPSPSRGWAGLIDRIIARVCARSIDDRLLNGGVTDGRPAVLVRRTRLLQRRYRAAVARALRRLIAEARADERNVLAAKPPLQVREIRKSAPLIQTLADEVEAEETVSPRGVILAERLVTDGGSPVYALTPHGHPLEASVESAVTHARAALHLG